MGAIAVMRHFFFCRSTVHATFSRRRSSRPVSAFERISSSQSTSIL